MITQFALLLSHGMSLMWCLMPRRQVTSGFFRIQSMVVLGLCVLAALAAGQLSPATAETTSSVPVFWIRTAAIVAASFAYVGSVMWRLEVRSVGTMCLFGVFAATLAGLIAVVPGLSSMPLATAIGHVLSLWSSAAVMGGATTGMLLGHWYLTAPTMSIEPLKRLTYLFLAALAIRFAVSAWGWSQAMASIHGSLIVTWWSLRWIAGILLPIVLAVMTDRILRYRNTQAATGVLFAGVILVFLGEMSAALLYAELHQPL